MERGIYGMISLSLCSRELPGLLLLSTGKLGHGTALCLCQLCATLGQLCPCPDLGRELPALPSAWLFVRNPYLLEIPPI